MSESSAGESPLSDDLLIGAAALSAWLGMSRRQVFYMVENKQLPLFKIGGKIAGRKSTLAQHFTKLEQGHVPDEAAA